MRKKPEPIRSDIVTDVSLMLDRAGVDGVQTRRLDSLLRSGISAQVFVDFAAAMHRRMGYRIGFGELLAEFTGAEQAA